MIGQERMGMDEMHEAFAAIPSMSTSAAMESVGLEPNAILEYARILMTILGEYMTPEGTFCTGILLGVAMERQRRGDSAQVDPRTER